MRPTLVPFFVAEGKEQGARDEGAERMSSWIMLISNCVSASLREKNASATKGESIA